MIHHPWTTGFTTGFHHGTTAHHSPGSQLHLPRLRAPSDQVLERRCAASAGWDHAQLPSHRPSRDGSGAAWRGMVRLHGGEMGLVAGWIGGLMMVKWAGWRMGESWLDDGEIWCFNGGWLVNAGWLVAGSMKVEWRAIASGDRWWWMMVTTVGGSGYYWLMGHSGGYLVISQNRETKKMVGLLL